jgi:hypothetical protein
MDKKHRGAHNELTAAIWLLKQGYEVFRNVSAFGAVDFVATKGDEVLKIDVKGGLFHPDGRGNAPRLSPEQITAGIKCLVVYPDGQCAFVESRPYLEVVQCRSCERKLRTVREDFLCSRCRNKAPNNARRGSIQLPN